ncbi:MAG: translocation/assembly module TamB domain-containing protein [Saprospiraceae bacterium]|nr:translocation/assembly module TamB domain-containing protein [Saprospiraceae bacterium]
MQTDTAGSWIADVYLKQLFWYGYVFNNTDFSGKQYAPTGMFLDLNLQTNFTQTTDTFPFPFDNNGKFTLVVDSLLFSDSLPFLVHGGFVIDSMQLYSEKGAIEADSFVGIFSSENRVNDVAFTSTWLNVNVSGLFDPLTAPSVLSEVVSYHFKPDSNLVYPSLPAGDTVFWQVDFQHPESLSGFLVPDLNALKPIKIIGGYRDGIFKTELFCEALNYAGFGGEMLYASVLLDQKEALAGLESGNLYFMDKLAPDSISIAVRAQSGILEGDVALFDSLNVTKVKLGADVVARDTQWMVQLDSSLVLQYATWTMDPLNKVVYNTTGGVGLVEHFRLERDSQLLSVEGDMVNNLKVELRAIDLGNVARILQRDSTFMSGNFNGTLRVDSLLSDQPHISARVGIRDLIMMMRPIGDLRASVTPAARDSFQTRLRITGANKVSLRGNFNVNGNLDMTARLDTLQLNVLEPWVGSILSELSGIVSGRLTYKGNYRNPLLNGRIAFDNARLRTPLNNVLYELPNDSLTITNNLIVLNNTRLFDKKRHPIVVNGTVDLGSMDNILLDLRAEGKDVLLLDSKEVASIAYYGVLYADVDGTVKGPLSSPVLNFRAKPLRGSEVNYLYDNGNTSINDASGIVEFITYDTTEQVVDTLPVTVFPFRLALDLELNQEENMLLRVFLNPLTRDIVEVRPFGDLHVDIFPQGDIELNGLVEFSEGKASYTYQNIFRRQFQLKQGSTLDWVKSPENPNINVEAFYEVRTSPVPLLSGGGQDSTYADYDKEMFWLVAKVTGYLDDLKIDFYVDYPVDSEDGTSYRNSGKEDIVRAVDNLNQNPEQQALEVFNLLVFNAFTGSSTSAGQAIDIQSNLNNLISQQLNNLTNDITWIDIDINLYSAGASSSQTNVDVTLKKDFFDKRLRFEIEGSTAVDSDSKSAQNNNSYFDNVSLEYRMDKKGVWKTTVFSNQEFNDFFQRNVTQSGAGVIFEKEFDGINWNFFKKKNKKQNTNPTSGTQQ